MVWLGRFKLKFATRLLLRLMFGDLHQRQRAMETPLRISKLIILLADAGRSRSPRPWFGVASVQLGAISRVRSTSLAVGGKRESNATKVILLFPRINFFPSECDVGEAGR
jgi:hypothetical protein